MNITNKLLLLVTGIILLILAGNFYFLNFQLRDYFKNNQLQWIETLTRSLSESIAQDTINENKVHVHELLERISTDEAIEYVYVTDMRGQLFSHSFKNGFPKFLLENISKHEKAGNGSHFDTKYKTKQGEIIEYDAALIEGLSARIYLGVNQSEVTKLIGQINVNMFMFFLLLAFLSVSLAVYIGRKISLPLTDFTQKLLDHNIAGLNKLPEIKTSDPDIRNLVNVFQRVINERDEAEYAGNISQQRLQLHRNQSPIGIIEWTTDFKFVDINPAAEKIFGFTKDEVLDKHIYENILPESAREHVDAIWKSLISNTGGHHSINENITKDGKIIICEWNNTPLINKQGNVIGVASFVEDITLQKQQEEKISRAQKMDALGKLTGGISHDYNNMLGVIIGYTELLQQGLKGQPELNKYTIEIMHASERGRKLTQKLLSFTRQKISEKTVINLNDILVDNKDLLEKTLTVRIKLEMDLADKMCDILVDENDLEDMLLNMSINAMHAMVEGGQLTLATRVEDLSIDDIEMIDLKVGRYVVFTITDTGVGMDSELVNHIFEPFYTTKGSRGTGLGLSQVYGFVNRSHGAIKVYSEPGHGTRFAIYFPCYDDSSDNNLYTDNNLYKLNDIEDSSLQGSETLLVVDDEVALGRYLKTVLEAQGYKVLLAEGGPSALDIIGTTHVDAVITDIIMPDMDGYELVSKIRQRFPKMKVQLLSGFNDARHQNKVDYELQQKLLYKPVNSKMMLKQIRQLLDD